jgi:hypothetical protein
VNRLSCCRVLASGASSAKLLDLPNVKLLVLRILENPLFGLHGGCAHSLVVVLGLCGVRKGILGHK